MRRRLADSASTRVDGVLLHLINTVSTKSSYKLKTLRSSLRTWLAAPKEQYFTTDGETLLAIIMLELLIDAKKKYSVLRLLLITDLMFRQWKHLRSLG